MPAPARPRDTSKVKSVVPIRPADTTNVRRASPRTNNRADAAGVPNREIIKRPKPAKPATAASTIPDRKLIRKTPAEHRLVAHRELFNGIVRTTFRCPCGKFFQDGTDHVTGKRLTRAEVVARLDRHRALK